MLTSRPKSFKDPLYIARPFFPPLEEFKAGLEDIWESQILTNNGPVLQKYHAELSDFLHNRHISLVSNGTLALQLTLQALDIKGEVITTPFTFVATSHALLWNNLKPAFVDIDPNTFNLDPLKVEQSITPDTKAILAVHVYGKPCDIKALEGIAIKHNLKIIYDAAHAFGVKIDGMPISRAGDASIFSFHATKMHHSAEGGLIVTNNEELTNKVNYLRNFGFENETNVAMPGTNAKMNELQALMGSINLQYFESNVRHRKALDTHYRKQLLEIPGVITPELPSKEVDYNYSYFPILIDAHSFGKTRDATYELMKEFNLFPRRYFYPLVCDFGCYQHLPRGELKVANKVANGVICLPIHTQMSEDDVEHVADIIRYIKSI